MNEPSLEDLLAEFIERREGGEALLPEDFASTHRGVAGLLPALRAACDADALLPGRRAPEHIGPYRVFAVLGSGGGGRVLEVEHRDQPGRRLALKLLPVTLRGVPRAVERFRREARALSRLEHPGIVRVLEIGEHEDTPYLVMELVEGEALSQRIARARNGAARATDTSRADLLGLPGHGDGVRRAAELVAGLARTVQAAHDAGLLHRDLKPGNVILRAGDGKPVLIDFGLAFTEDAATLTATGEVLGTPSYMAPEQARGQATDARTDVYGLGAVLYELLTLQAPHRGEQVHEVLERVQRAPPRPVRSLDRRIPRALEDIVRRGTAFRRERRFATAAEMAAALEAFASGRAAGRTTLGVGARLEDFLLWHGRRVRAVAIAILLLGGALAGAVLWRHDRDRQAQEAAVVAAAAYLDGSAAARAALMRLRAVDPDSALARYALARLDGKPGGVDDPYYRLLGEGEDLLASKKAEQAFAVLDRARTQRRDDALALGLSGIAAARAGNLHRAELDLSAAARLLPLCSKLHKELAWVYRRTDRFDLAVESMRAAIGAAPANADHWHDLARMLGHAKRNEDALAAVDKAMALAGNESLLYLRTKGALLDGLKRHDEAIAILRRIVARQPTVEHWRSLGMSLDSSHRIEEARDAYLRGLELEPSHLPTLLALAHLHAGEREDCDDCRAFFMARPDLLDANLVEEYALRGLAADHGEFKVTSLFAGYLRRFGRTERFRRAIDELLSADFDAVALGRLVQAKRELAEGK